MNAPIRKPAFKAAAPTRAATVYTGDPSPHLEQHYRHVWQSGMCDMPFVNEHLNIAAVDFRPYRGDWVGAIVTPWFINLFVLPGGGELWRDCASGDRVRLTFPVGELEFIADYDPGGTLEACLYCPLFAPVSQFAGQEAALAAAQAALEALFTPREPPAADLPAKADTPRTEAPPARRAFFQRVCGVQGEPHTPS